MATNAARAVARWTAWLLGSWVAASCAPRGPASASPAPLPSASSGASSSLVRAAPNATQPPPSPRCVAQCNAKHEASKTSMCKFCRAHQLGAPADRFEEFDRSCSQTCDHERRVCLEACEGRAR